MPCTGGPPRPFLGRRSALRVRLPRPTGWGTVPRYTYRRLAKLPSTADQLRRHTVLNLPGMLHGLSFEHTVMEPGAGVPYGMHTLGGTDWVYVVLQAPIE